jgi:hypothetical protein
LKQQAQEFLMQVSTDDRRNASGDILRRLFEPDKADLSPEVARYLLGVEFSTADRERMDALAEKSQAGELSDEERDELDDYVRIGHLLAIVQSKARKSLAPHRAAS